MSFMDFITPWCSVLLFMLLCLNHYCVPDSKVHGANMGPIWGRQDPGGPHVGPMNIAIWGTMFRYPFVNQFNMVVIQVFAKYWEKTSTNSLMEYSLQVDHVICVLHYSFLCCLQYHVILQSVIMRFHDGKFLSRTMTRQCNLIPALHVAPTSTRASRVCWKGDCGLHMSQIISRR